MKENTILYQVKSGDTIKSISGRLGMTEAELKNFHNTNCGKQNQIWFDNLLAIDVLVLPTNFETAETVEKKKAKELPTAISEAFFYPEYRVEEIFENSDRNVLKIEYDLLLEFKTDKTHESTINIDRKNFSNNGIKPDDKMSEISIKCMESIAPIPFVFSSGKIVDFQNHEELVQTFKTERKNLEDFYVGEVYKNYLNLFENNISDQKYFLEQLKSTLLFQVLFPKIKWFQKKESWTETFYLRQNSFPLHLNCMAEYHHENADFVETVITAKVDENVSLQEFLRGIKLDETPEEPIVGELTLRYQTHKIKHTLESAEAVITLWHDDELYQKQSLTLTKS